MTDADAGSRPSDSGPGSRWSDVDPFDLPEWLGIHEITWSAGGSFDDPVLIGELRDDADGTALPCDLIAADVAYPRPVVDEPTRTAIHLAWRLGQVRLLCRRDASQIHDDAGPEMSGATETPLPGRLCLAVPTIAHDTDSVLEVIGRLAEAVGAPRSRFAVRLRAGR